MIGTTLGHFRLESELGEGGMGVVYRARDLNLERDVALKLLPERALTNEEARLRFRREALALSRLNHPHIGAIYDFVSDGTNEFLVMELVPGQTLAERLKSGPLPEPELVTVGRQIADALEAAHEQGVIHRDLKPGNVMITPRGQVKVLDFGLAKLEATSDRAPADALTGPQVVTGTLPYMAPEALLGEPSDERSDLFALGALLYEASTGRPPFTAKISTALVNEILNRTPTSPRAIGATLSPAFESTILRLLEKDPANRPRTASDLRTELERVALGWGPGMKPARPRIESLAVLPLENLARDPEQEYFADGMTESLISDLAKIGSLRVVSRTSALRFRGVARPLPEVARELGVDAVVEGSVLRVGDRVRITARLIEAATDRPIWSERYERDLHDVLTLQSEVAATIAEAIQGSLTGEERARLAGTKRLDPRAYEAYLKGRYAWNRRTEEGIRKGIELFESAIEIDPTYAQAYAGLADSYNLLGDNNWVSPETSFARARAAAERAIQLDPDSPEAYASLAYVADANDWDWQKAEQLYRKSIELGPEYATGHQWYGSHLSQLGRHEDAITEAKLAIRLDPLSLVLYLSLGDTYYYAWRFQDAIEQYQRALELDPRYYLALTDLARSLEQSGRYEEAYAMYVRGAEVGGKDPQLSAGLACAYAYGGRRQDAIRIREALVEREKHTHVPAYAIASIHAALGETDSAFQWLERALVKRDRAMVLLCVNPRFEKLRTDLRFQDLARRTGLPEELIARTVAATAG